MSLPMTAPVSIAVGAAAWRGTLLFGHRGAPTLERENTFASFARALADGAHAIETDAHLSSDGHVMLVHDAELQRVFGVAQRVSTLARAQLEALGIPALADVLAVHATVPINIDLKQRHPPMQRVVVQLLEAQGASQRVLLTSFYDDVVQSVRDMGYDGPTGMGFKEIRRLYALPLTLLKVWRVQGARAQVPVQSGRAHFARRAFIDKCHALQVAVDFWVVNELAQAQELLALGADGIMSDNPAAVVAAFAPPQP